MSKYIMDMESAWAELERFADHAGVEMDERAHPCHKREPSEEDDDADAESEVADYSTLLQAIRKGEVTVTESGELQYAWRQPFGAGESLILNPNGWPYGRAMRALATTVTVIQKGRKKRDAEVEKRDTLGQGDAFLEILARMKQGSLMDITHKRDRDIATKLTVFMVSE